MSSLWQGEVVANSPVGPGIYHLRLRVALPGALPGQFVHLRCGSSLDPLLRRPLSIHDYNPAGQEVQLLYQVVGRGTAWLAGRKPGDFIDGLGPLGRGFTLPAGPRVALVAGGLGLAPLFFLARVAAAEGCQVTFYVGARSREGLLRLEALEGLGLEVQRATDDGSAGFAGPVTSLLARDLEYKRYDQIFACGPRAMLAEVARLAGQKGIPAEVSLEERMACGLGACRGCVVALYGEDGSIAYENVCSAGPVFPAEKIVW
ncbi:dihydroorotate dehydrogenase electron transfer subunit [Thermanaeromonas sp. C210]|uniref:dihydroorotate dehydrogenase electron transfer subunit n=1 Tax=Thermanaeromonas sp. C210 TaxID=2731925 RepID=UPI00155C092A|nr:dihydroorotate dehydrogenase electron transfer subunit [Thermanaeromonas sp. C210]GFN22075.1 dihydroorotate dehydrogenase B (NAD(+)), electron transfer subunit [Thermanaeromonas sp. C210]